VDISRVWVEKLDGLQKTPLDAQCIGVEFVVASELMSGPDSSGGPP